MRKNVQKPIAWDSLYIQLIVLLLAIVGLIIGAAYFIPSNAIGQGYYPGEQANSLPTIIVTTDADPGNIAGGAYNPGGASVTDSNTQYQNQIECNDGIDNDKNGLVDLADSKCKTRWDTSEKY